MKVGKYGANPFHLYGKHGNVWEWIEDCWNGKLGGVVAKGKTRTTGYCIRRVLRGGGWDGNPQFLRAADRNWDRAGNRSYFGGFRLARPLTH